MFFGSIGQRISGLRWTFVLGQTLLFVTILLFALSRSVTLLLIARLVQGFACGAVFTAGYPLLYDVFGSGQIGQALGYTSMSLSLGFFMGPIVGGFLYDAVGFEWALVPTMILTGLEVVLRLLVVEPLPPNSQANQDGERQALEANDAQKPLLGSTAEASRRPTAESVSQVSSYGTAPTEGSSDPISKSPAQSPLRILLSNSRFLTAMGSLFMVNS